MVSFLSNQEYTYFKPWEFNGNGNANGDNNRNDDNSVNNNNGNVNNNNGNNGNNGNNNGGVNNNNNNGNVNNNNGNNNVNVNNNNSNANNDNSNSVFRPQSSSLAIVDQFYDATYCWGTKDEQMEQALKNINSNNVMDVMKAWNLVHSTEKGESFMKAFMWDADHGQKEQYGKQIAAALRDRALATGVFEDCREDFAIIDQELRSWFFISNDISKNFDNIIAKIAEAENSTNGNPYEQSSQTDGWHSVFRGTLA